MEHVLNWLWQGCAVAAATFVILHAAARARAHFRYVLCWIVLAIVLALPLVTIVTAGAGAAAPGPAGPASTGAPAVVFVVPETWWTSTAAALAAAAAWTFVCSARIAVDLIAVRRARRRCRPLPPALASRLGCWTRARGRGRATRLMLSRDVRAAAMLGCGSPVIAVTPALVRHLTAAELDRVVIHEWAHVQRRDDWLNVLQLAAGAIAGWHPAIWWVNRQLHIEREAACDEMTVAMTGSAKAYAASLARTAGLRPARRRFVAAPGVLSSPGLRTRIVRILGYRRLESKIRSAGTATTAAATIFGLALCVGGLRLVGTPALAASLEATRPSASAVAAGQRSLAVAPDTRKIRRPLVPAPRPSRQPAAAHPAIAEHDISPRLAASDAVSIGREPANPDPVIPRTDPPPPAVASFQPVTPAAMPAVNGVSLGAPPAPVPPASADAATPWGLAADAGVSVGRASQKAAVATAGFFTRLGRKIAGSLENPR